MLYKTTILAMGLAAVSGTTYTPDPSQQQFLWKQFKQEYHRSYDEIEEPKRFQVFIENLKIIDERNNAEAGSAVHGINKFSDLSEEEFKSRYLTAVPNPGAQAGKVVLDYVEPYHGPSSLVDWTGRFTTPVKDQGYCGSCWAFSATEQIESDAIRQLGVSTATLLSTEQVTQCTNGAFGCGGGWTETAYAYVKNAGGLVSEAEYPYTSYYGITGVCNVNTNNAVVGISSYTTIKGESNMASYVQSTGPLSVCVDASNWSSYSGGILTVCGTSVNHCVQAVGVDTSSYWKVRNSWGTSWGESGFIRLAYGKNTCAITNDPTYVSTFLA